MSARKTKPGEVFTDLKSLIDWLDAGLYVYERSTPRHPLWIQNYTLSWLKVLISHGHLRECLTRYTDKPYCCRQVHLEIGGVDIPELRGAQQ